MSTGLSPYCNQFIQPQTCTAKLTARIDKRCLSDEMRASYSVHDVVTARNDAHVYIDISKSLHSIEISKIKKYIYVLT